MTNAQHLMLSCLVLVGLAFAVGSRMLFCRVREMRSKRVHPQAAATRAQMSERLQDTQAADNFQNLFETPVLFYALCAMAMAQQRMPDWLVAGAWAYVSLRVVHTLIHCTYNRVMHRLAAFLASFVLLVILWAAWVISGL
ncbi:MAPEG family protein [Ideonella paludis]|uniref:MAPEG family protein n=1 Tax=Ideonella paludis TaxID=1233411 RepID=A0ABS5DT64_9BURK|nr:MAPEG family protein [Ideonella paludis]MBQ0934274.1 MAPEG family protein [Ideonella paludis]